jgi:hypothetical protein
MSWDYTYKLFNLDNFQQLDDRIGVWQVKNFFNEKMIKTIESKILSNYTSHLKESVDDSSRYLEERIVSPNIHLILHILSDVNLYQFLSDRTGITGLNLCSPRIFKFIPGENHHFDWHNDYTENKALGFSINLTREKFEGGVFSIRYQAKPEINFSIQNHGLGDAIFFKIAKDIDHSVTKITGNVERITCAGWFHN